MIINNNIKKFYIITECPYVGVLRSLLNLGNLSKENGYEVEFILPKTHRDRYGESQSKNEESLRKIGNISYLPLRRKFVYMFSDISHFLKKFKNTKENIIIISITEYAGYITRLSYLFLNKNIKLIQSHQCLDLKRKSGLSFLKHFMLESICKNFCDYYLACSYSESNILRDELNISKNKILLLRNSVLNKDIMNLSEKNNNNNNNYIYVGRIVTEKRVDILLRAFEKISYSKKLLIIGEGKMLQTLKNKYKDVNFYGSLDHYKVFNLLDKFTFFVSASKIEGLSFSLLEAMSRGVIPIVSNVPGHIDVVVNNYNGFIFSNQKDLEEILIYTSNLKKDDILKLSNNAIKSSKENTLYAEKDFKNFLNIIDNK